jgi:RNA polymerase sigma-70 factor (ECF subfamily)
VSERAENAKLVAVQDYTGIGDEDLMLRYKDGDVGAFDVLVRRHRRGVINFLFRMTNDRATAQEVEGDTWLKIHRAASRYEPRARFTTYLYTVAYRQCLTVLGSKAQRVQAAGVDVDVLDRAVVSGSAKSDGPAPDPERQVIVDRQLQRLNEEVHNLPEAHKAAFLLYYVEGLSCKDIAGVLNLAAKEVKGRLAYARRLLRERVVLT